MNDLKMKKVVKHLDFFQVIICSLCSTRAMQITYFITHEKQFQLKFHAKLTQNMKRGFVFQPFIKLENVPLTAKMCVCLHSVLVTAFNMLCVYGMINGDTTQYAGFSFGARTLYAFKAQLGVNKNLKYDIFINKCFTESLTYVVYVYVIFCHIIRQLRCYVTKLEIYDILK